MGFTESFASNTRVWYRREIINLAERWLNTIESDGLYFEEWFNFLSENFPNKIFFKRDITYETISILLIEFMPRNAINLYVKFNFTFGNFC